MDGRNTWEGGWDTCKQQIGGAEQCLIVLSQLLPVQCSRLGMEWLEAAWWEREELGVLVGSS